MNLQLQLNRLFVLILLTTLIACEKEPPTFTPPDSSYGLIYTHIFQTSCALSGCHDGTSRYPSLSGEDVYQNIINGVVQNAQASQAGLQLIIPNSPDSSFLYAKIDFDNTQFKFGSRMPLGGLEVDDDKITFLKKWIEAGAPESGHVADRTLIE